MQNKEYVHDTLLEAAHITQPLSSDDRTNVFTQLHSTLEMFTEDIDWIYLFCTIWELLSRVGALTEYSHRAKVEAKVKKIKDRTKNIKGNVRFRLV